MRRKKTLKFHAIAIAAICAVIVVLYLLIGPKDVGPLDPNEATGDRYIRLISASWGLNCNAEIGRLRARGMLTTTKDGSSVPLAPVLPNNALFALSEPCNGKLTCNVQATNHLMAVDPLTTCFKQLVVTYRCFSIDRQWRTEIDQGDTLSIDCHEAADKDRK